MLKRRPIDMISKEVDSKSTTQNHHSNKIVVKHKDITRSLDLLDLIDYGRKDKRGYIHFF